MAASRIKPHLNGTANGTANGFHSRLNGAAAPRPKRKARPRPKAKAKTKDRTDRNPNGTFKPGCKGGPGRPPRRTELSYLAVIPAIVTLEEWAQVVFRAVQDAMKGKESARNWLTGLLLGPEAQRMSFSKLLAKQVMCGESLQRAVEEDLANTLGPMLQNRVCHVLITDNPFQAEAEKLAGTKRPITLVPKRL
jgi:hypothetical protein